MPRRAGGPTASHSSQPAQCTVAIAIAIASTVAARPRSSPIPSLPWPLPDLFSPMVTSITCNANRSQGKGIHRSQPVQSPRSEIAVVVIKIFVVLPTAKVMRVQRCQPCTALRCRCVVGGQPRFCARDAPRFAVHAEGICSQNRTDQPFVNVNSTKQHFCQVDSTQPAPHPTSRSYALCVAVEKSRSSSPASQQPPPVNSITTNQSPGPRTGGLARESTSRNGNSGFLSIAQDRNEFQQCAIPRRERTPPGCARVKSRLDAVVNGGREADI